MYNLDFYFKILKKNEIQEEDEWSNYIYLKKFDGSSLFEKNVSFHKLVSI